MVKKEIAVRVGHERWKAALKAHKTTEVELAKKIGKSRVTFGNWIGRRGGFTQELVDAITEAGIHVHEYAGPAGEPTSHKDIEDAFVRAMERFYGVKEGEYAQWLITTMNAVTRHACREVNNGSKVPKIQRHYNGPREDLRSVDGRGGRAGGDDAADIVPAPGLPQGDDAQRAASGE